MGLQPRIVVGCDPSSKHLAFMAEEPLTRTILHAKFDLRINGGRKSAKYEPAVAESAYDAAWAFARQVRLASPKSERVVYIEAAAVVSGRANQCIVQAYTSGAAQAAFVSEGFEVYLVSIGTWKKDVCGNGAAKKEDVARTIKFVWPKAAQMAGKDQDLLDAAAISYFGRFNEIREGRMDTGSPRRNVDAGSSL